MSSDASLSIRDIVDLALARDEAAFVAELGLGALIGTLPTSTEGWAYHTNLKRRFSPLMPGIELASSRVFVLQKTQSTFPETLLIGRASSNDVVIADASISKLHARVRMSEGRVWIKDAGSRNGTEVAGKRIEDAVELSQGTYVDLGDCSFVFYEPAALYRAALELSREPDL